MDPYAAIATAANWATASADGVNVGVALAALFVVYRGTRLLLGMIKR